MRLYFKPWRDFLNGYFKTDFFSSRYFSEVEEPGQKCEREYCNSDGKHGDSLERFSVRWKQQTPLPDRKRLCASWEGKYERFVDLRKYEFYTDTGHS